MILEPKTLRVSHMSTNPINSGNPTNTNSVSIGRGLNSIIGNYTNQDQYSYSIAYHLKTLPSNIINTNSSDSTVSNNSKIIRQTLTPLAIRQDKYDFISGNFNQGYPVNNEYYLCSQNLTSVFQYGESFVSKSYKVGQYPTLSTTSTVNKNNKHLYCVDNNLNCSLPCASGSVFDPVSCICTLPEECVPQPSCEPLIIPPDLKPIIKGYAFYVASTTSVDIPDIGPVLTSCAGGHTCCSTIFMPTIKDSNNNLILANKSINMNNVPGVFCPEIDARIPVPGFVSTSKYDISDSFQFVINDPSALIDSNLYLQCQLDNCHNGVTFIVLVGEQNDNTPVLLFASCVSPGAVDAVPLGTIDCGSGPAGPCDPPPPPPPSPTPNPYGDPVCLPQRSWFGVGTTGGGCGNPPNIYGEQTISIPSGLTAPVYVELIGGADDLLIIDGEVVDAGQIDNGFGCLVSAGNYAFVLNSPSFTIAAGDTAGVNSGYSYQICFYNVVYS